jgi:hypothetical protein
LTTRTPRTPTARGSLLDAHSVLIAVLMATAGNVDRVEHLVPTDAGSPVHFREVGQDHGQQLDHDFAIHTAQCSPGAGA